MATYEELQKQIAELQEQAAQARKQEMTGAIAQIKDIMTRNGLSPEDLGFGFGKTVRVKTKAAAAFRDPVSGATWSGKGRRPQWLINATEAGRSPEEFRI